MASAQEEVAPTQDAAAVYEQIEQYPWDTDSEFQSGLAAILGPDPSPEQEAKLSTRARCFYFSRKFNTKVDFDAYKAWKEQRDAEQLTPVNGTAQATTTTQPDPGPKFSYQEIVDMIQSGKPVPGIKDIPDTVLAGQGTSSTATTRRKPWEKDGETADIAEVVGESGAVAT